MKWSGSLSTARAVSGSAVIHPRPGTFMIGLANIPSQFRNGSARTGGRQQPMLVRDRARADPVGEWIEDALPDRCAEVLRYWHGDNLARLAGMAVTETIRERYDREALERRTAQSKSSESLRSSDDSRS